MRKRFHLTPRQLTQAISIAITLGTLPHGAQAAVRTWDGDGYNDNWGFVNTSIIKFGLTNWTDNAVRNCIGCALQPPLAAGDSLVFAGNRSLTPYNDLTGGVYAGLSFAANAGAFTLNGNAITSTGNINNNSNKLQTINMPIIVGSDQTWDGGRAGITVNGAVTLGNHNLTLQNQTTIDNSNTDFIVGGLSGTTSLTLKSGSRLFNRFGQIGNQYGNSTVEVNGDGSLWENSALYIGDANSEGTLNILNGGMVNSSSSFLGNYAQRLFNTSRGTVTVDGQNSRWFNSGSLYIATGTVNIRNSGTVIVNYALNIDKEGVLNLDGGWLSIHSQRYSNTGQFNWLSGVLGLLDENGVTLGSNVFTPAMTHLGKNQILNVYNTLTVNNDNVLLLNGGQVRAGTLALNGGIVAGTALDAGGIGTLKGYGTVASAITGGTANTIQANDGDLSLGNLNATNGFDFGGQLIVGSHRVVLLDQDQAQLGFRTTLGDGGQLEAGKGMVLGNNEALSYSGNASILGNFTNNGAVSGSSGTLTFLNDVKGAGSFAGDIAFHAAYNPGNSPAAIDFNGGNATYDASSVLTIEIFGNSPGSEYDQLLNINHLNFNGTLALVFGNHFTPTAGSSFNLFGFNQFSGSFAPDRITVTGLDRSLLDFSNLASNGRLQVAAVPLPAGAWLFGSGLAMLALARRKGV